ncbi:hypothetical protein AMECASPLE_021812 [Ameca splendens]|uniref:Uncharacterized protein n=1 Tax=Ameca splendens TaxID=208324 RepID=A0ABV0Y3K3_9TELE
MPRCSVSILLDLTESTLDCQFPLSLWKLRIILLSVRSPASPPSNSCWKHLPKRIQWVPDISHHCPGTPFLLVGTQIDLQEDGATVQNLTKAKQRLIFAERKIFSRYVQQEAVYPFLVWFAAAHKVIPPSNPDETNA